MVSKTRMLDLVKAWDAAAVDAALVETPGLLDVRDPRGRNWLHIACGRKLAGDPAASLATVDVLLGHGLPLDGEAFREGEWRATPLWFAVAHGQNRPLAEHLLRRGCTPNYCLWAAAWNDDPEMIRLLVAHGADIEDFTAPGEKPLLWAVKWSKFRAAEALLELGAEPDAQDGAGRTAVHCMLKKGSDPAHVELFIRKGARIDIPDGEGRTAREILARKRDPRLRRLAETA